VAISANANNQPRCSRPSLELSQHYNLNKIIGRSLEFFALQKIGMTSLKDWLGGMGQKIQLIYCINPNTKSGLGVGEINLAMVNRSNFMHYSQAQTATFDVLSGGTIKSLSQF